MSCPRCGYCPHCGRGDYYSQPAWPGYPFWWGTVLPAIQPTITWSVSSDSTIVAGCNTYPQVSAKENK